MGFTIKQAQEITGLSADTLRYYEKEGIINAGRGDNGYRYYDELDIGLLKYIVVMKYARFTLAEIKSMAKLYGRQPTEECANICTGILTSKINELKQTISNYQKIVELMEASLPMVGVVDPIENSELIIDGYIRGIFDDIQSGKLFSEGSE